MRDLLPGIAQSKDQMNKSLCCIPQLMPVALVILPRDQAL